MRRWYHAGVVIHSWVVMEQLFIPMRLIGGLIICHNCIKFLAERRRNRSFVPSDLQLLRIVCHDERVRHFAAGGSVPKGRSWPAINRRRVTTLEGFYVVVEEIRIRAITQPRI